MNSCSSARIETFTAAEFLLTALPRTGYLPFIDVLRLSFRKLSGAVSRPVRPGPL
jgi:hypothetical protein